MTSSTYLRGHKVIWDANRGWIYADDRTPAKMDRPCKLCGRWPTPEGHDACLGHLPGVSNACCGHGVPEVAYIHSNDKEGELKCPSMTG